MKNEDKQSDWVNKLNSSDDFLKNYLETCEKISEIYLPTKKNSRTKFKFNLFNSNVSVLMSALFARLPVPTVSRKFSDSSNQVGRVASTILERAITFDIGANNSFKNATKMALKDYLTVGSGWLYAKYNVDVAEPEIISSQETDELAEGSVVIKNQQVGVEFCSWKDVRWSPARNWEEVCWWGRRVWMTEDDFIERFGKEKARDVDFDGHPEDEDNTEISEGRVGVWEIWDKDTRKIFYIVKCCEDVLDEVDDPYGLPEFFPVHPLFANISNDQFIPVSDFQLLEFQYRSLEEVNLRIARLSKSIRLAGVYNAEHPEVRQLLETAGDSVMVPVSNWSSFTEKGQLAGSFSFLPIQEMATVLAQLQQTRAEMLQQIEQISGISDIIRGVNSNQYESAAATRLKSQYSNVRLGSKSTDLSETLTYIIKCFGHFICRFYQPEQLLSRIGEIQQADQPFIGPALQILSDELTRMFILEVSSDSLKAADFERDTMEKTMVLQQLSSYIPQAIQGAQQVPELAPIFMELLRWVVSGTRGAREIEGMLDTAMQQYSASQAEKMANPQEERPDPAMEQIKAQLQMNQMSQETDRMKMQQQMQIEQMKLEHAFQLKQLELQNEQQKLAIEAQRLQIDAEKLAIMREQAEAQALIDAQKLKMQDDHFMMELTKQDSSEQKINELQAKLDEEIITPVQTVEMMKSVMDNVVSQINKPATVKVSRDENGNLVGTIEPEQFDQE